MDSQSELEQSQQNPELQKDPRIPKVIQELSESARLLKEPRLLNMSSNPEKPPAWIEYEGADREIISLNSYDFQRPDLALTNLPTEFREYERIVPIHVRQVRLTTPGGIEYTPMIRVWMTLDNNPKIFELVSKDGKSLLAGNEIITGEEKVVERLDLLPRIVKAVSGKKCIINKKSVGSTVFERGDWKNTFDTE